MTGCSAFNLSPCLAPVYAWWTSVEAWSAWIEFGAAVFIILGLLALVDHFFGRQIASAVFAAIIAAIFYRRGQKGEPFNPIPPIPGDKPAPKPPLKR